MSTSVISSAPDARSDSVPPALDFCADLPPFRAVNGSVIETVRPYNLCDHSGPFLFRLSRDPIRYLQPNFLRLTGMMRILEDSSNVIGSDATVTPIDGYGQALINKVEVHVNNKIVSDGGGGNYHHKVLVQSLLNYDQSAFDTHLRASGFACHADDDVPNQTPSQIEAGAEGWEWPTNWGHMKDNSERFAGSKWVQFSIDLQVDLFRTNREFPNDMNIELHIFRNSDDYLLHQSADDTGNYSLHLKDLQLHVRKVQPSSSLLAANNRLLEQKGARFQFNNIVFDKYILPESQQEFFSTTMFRGRVPGYS